MYINLAIGCLAASLALLVSESLGVFTAANFRKLSLLAGLACALLWFLKGRDTAARDAASPERLGQSDRDR